MIAANISVVGAYKFRMALVTVVDTTQVTVTICDIRLALVTQVTNLDM